MPENWNKTAYFSKLDLNYPFCQFIFDLETAQFCDFKIVSGESTGSYKIITALICLKDTSVAFLKTMHHTLIVLKTTHGFINDIIIVSCFKNEDQLILVYKCLNKLNKINLKINLLNAFLNKNDWFCYRLTENGISPFESKEAAILKSSPPKSLSQFTTLGVCLHRPSKIFFNPAHLCPLSHLSKNLVYFFNQNKNLFIEQIALAARHLRHNQTMATRIKCDASSPRLGA